MGNIISSMNLYSELFYNKYCLIEAERIRKYLPEWTNWEELIKRRGEVLLSFTGNGLVRD